MADSAANVAGLLCLAGAVLVVFVAVSIEAGRWSAAKWLSRVLLGTALAVVGGLVCSALAPALLPVVAPVYFAGMLAMPTLAIGSVKWPRVRRALWVALIALWLLPTFWLLRLG